MRLYMQEGNTIWYDNSMAPIVEEARSGGLAYKHKFQSAKAIYNLYCKRYGVKLNFNGGYLEYVEFPSEDEAVMFMLRWG